MHEVIQNGLEEYLGGQVRRDFQAHLDRCAECRSEVLELQDVSGFLHELRPAELLQPEPGFYFRLTQNLESQRKPSFWSVFSLDAAFGRRVAFASLMTLALVGGFLVSTESGFTNPSNASTVEAVMASHDVSTPHESSADRDRMMFTLASYTQ